MHELQRERDLSAGWVGSGRDAGYGGVVAQRVAVNQALQTFRRDVEDLGNEGSAFRERVDAAVAELEQLDEQRGLIENDEDMTGPADARLLLEASSATCSPSTSRSPARPTTGT